MSNYTKTTFIKTYIPVDGFYEWKKVGKSKIPYYIRLKSGELFTLAGLWSFWVGPDGKELKTFTIITTQPNDSPECIAPV